MYTITECIVSAYGDKIIYAKPVKILYDFGGQVVFLNVLNILYMIRNKNILKNAFPFYLFIKEFYTR